MCGLIAAVSIDAPIDRERFEQARDSIAHRGPDGSGAAYFRNDHVALGHRRLSIIDLSEAASQPMGVDSLWVVFNGEIYNFPELRRTLEAEGCRFKSHSDTEILLHGYRVWGERLCDHLEGMFAFAIYDDRDCTLFLGRDHTGQKPLFFLHAGPKLVVASEIKAIRSLFGNHASVRPESLLDYLVYDYVPDPYTWYEHIFSVMPGRCTQVRWANGAFDLQEQEYWTFKPPVEPNAISREAALALVDGEIRRSVSSHLLADVEVGALLSGGVDSGTVVAVASEVASSPLRTFSIGFGSPDNDELPLARLVSDRYRTVHTEEIVSEEDYVASLDRILDVFDQPFADTSLVPTLAVSAVASKHVKVVLTGDGGDEAFGGYNLGAYISPFLGKGLWRRRSLSRGYANEVLRFARDALSYLTMSQEQWNARKHYPKYMASARRELRLMPAELRHTLEAYEYRWMFPPNTVRGLDAFRQAQWHRIKHILPGRMLTKIDRCSMQYSLEARAPFLSHKLIEAMLSLPTEIKNPKQDWYKGLLRSWASSRLPEAVLSAPKRGFNVPKGWTALPKNEMSMNALRRTVEKGLIAPAAWSDLARKKTLLWKVLQIERAIARGLI